MFALFLLSLYLTCIYAHLNSKQQIIQISQPKQIYTIKEVIKNGNITLFNFSFIVFNLKFFCLSFQQFNLLKNTIYSKGVLKSVLLRLIS